MNRLARENSLYLRDHAANPVDWYPWGPEAWAKARQEDKPIFLSIGYSACHWCHVMARESFEDKEVADILNKHFVSIKVDREERPEVDEVYIEAVRILTSTAGWPLSVFLTPSLKPFYGGSYYPPKPRHGLPAFNRVLLSVVAHYAQYRDDIEKAGDTITQKLAELSELPVHDGELGDEPLHRFYRQRLEVFDSEHGGFGIAPKFPNPSDLMLLLRLSGRPGFDQALSMAQMTLDRMAQGGIYDQLGGGFHRYSTDTIWLVPHFEKMLYDNALLAQTYALAFQTTGNDAYRMVAEETLDWLEREMLSPAGGFCSSLDADTGEREGAFYLWAVDEVERILGPDLAPVAFDLYGISPAGNFHGENVLRFAAPAEDLMARHGLSQTDLWDKLDDIKSAMLAARAGRPHPRREGKILADWNGLALSAFAHAHVLLGRTDNHYLEVANRLADFVASSLVSAGALSHVRREGQDPVPGNIADYALVAQGLLDLYDADWDTARLRLARQLTDRMIARFHDEAGGFFTTAEHAPGLLTRTKNGYDGAVPSGNSVAALNLLRLARLTGDTSYERLGAATVRWFYATMKSYPAAFNRMMLALDFLIRPGTELVVFIPDTAQEKDFLDVLRHAPGPNRTTILIRGDSADTETAELVPLVQGRGATDGRPTAYLCRNYTCSAPVHTPEELESALKASPVDTGAAAP
ncbi:MAG: thioredoxin domain-containing protein [candidate division WOR-3 bacterium]|nr:MAG: thioredoxin domain-containing protein [candidate division WOR-3 bacterium]